jgi:hypothetical protein
MIKPGGFLLSNDFLAEGAPSQLKEAGRITVLYSKRTADAEVVFWYKRMSGDGKQHKK